MQNFKNICVLRLSALGDCINTFAFIKGLLESNKDLNIEWVIDKRFAPLFRDEHGNDLIKMHALDIKGRGYKSYFDLKRSLNNKKYDALLNIQTSLKASLLSLAIKAPIKVGYDKKRQREGQSLFVNKNAIESNDLHVVSGFLGFSKALGFDVTPSYDLSLSNSEIEKAKELLTTNKKIFLLSPCSAKEQKNWNNEGYISICKFMQSKGYCVLLVGSSSQKELDTCSLIENAISKDGECINACGKTNLRTLACLCKLSDIALCPDSGTMHLCSFLNTDVVGLFAVHSEKRVGPYRHMQYCVSVYDELAFYELKTKDIPWRYRVKDERAMDHIKVLDVQNMLEKIIDKKES